MISQKGRHAIRFMIDLAEQPEGFPVPLEDIAIRQEISKKYPETVVNLLVKAKPVKGSADPSAEAQKNKIRKKQYVLRTCVLF